MTLYIIIAGRKTRVDHPDRSRKNVVSPIVTLHLNGKYITETGLVGLYIFKLSRKYILAYAVSTKREVERYWEIKKVK